MIFEIWKFCHHFKVQINYFLYWLNAEKLGRLWGCGARLHLGCLRVFWTIQIANREKIGGNKFGTFKTLLDGQDARSGITWPCPMVTHVFFLLNDLLPCFTLLIFCHYLCGLSAVRTQDSENTIE